MFLEYGYKETNISEIAKRADISVGSFYKYYQSKEEIFLEIYVNENESIRKKIIDKIDWDVKPVEVVDQLFKYVFEFTSSNRILSEWNNDSISETLKEYYSEQKNTDNYAFNQFITEAFREKLNEKNFDPEMTDKLLKVYDLIYFIDCHVTTEKFNGYEESLWILVKYFIKGVFIPE